MSLWNGNISINTHFSLFINNLEDNTNFFIFASLVNFCMIKEPRKMGTSTTMHIQNVETNLRNVRGS